MQELSHTKPLAYMQELSHTKPLAFLGQELTSLGERTWVKLDVRTEEDRLSAVRPGALFHLHLQAATRGGHPRG